MNIFAINKDAETCARFLDDGRLVKMCLESAQLLSSAARLNGYIGSDLYRLTHKGHPCTRWTAECQGNYVWLLAHFIWLCEEYRSRFGKEHKCESLYHSLCRAQLLLPEGERDGDGMLLTTAFINCTPHKDADVHEAYVETLTAKWNESYKRGHHARFYSCTLPAYSKRGCNANPHT